MPELDQLRGSVEVVLPIETSLCSWLRVVLVAEVVVVGFVVQPDD